MPFSQPQSSSLSVAPANSAERRNSMPTEAHPQSVCGIVLAGSHHWGDTAFERMFRGPLLPVAQVPVICYPLGWLRDGGVSEARICANSMTAPVHQYLGTGDRLGLSLEYYEDHSPRGPAGCARDAADMSNAETFVVVEGSMIPTVDLASLLEAHRESGASATIVVEVDRRRRAIEGTELRLPGGIYVLSREVLNTVAKNGYQDIKEGLLERLYKTGNAVMTYELSGVSPRVLDYPTYTSVNRWLTAKAVENQTYLANYVRVGDALIHPTAEVDSSARLVGPVIVGPHASVGEGAMVVGASTIGRGSVVAAGALVSRSIVWSNCWVGAKAVVDDTLLADHCIVEPGHQLFGAVHIAPANRPVPASTNIPSEAVETAAVPDRKFWSSLGLVTSVGLRREASAV